MSPRFPTLQDEARFILERSGEVGADRRRAENRSQQAQQENNSRFQAQDLNGQGEELKAKLEPQAKKTMDNENTVSNTSVVRVREEVNANVAVRSMDVEAK